MITLFLVDDLTEVRDMVRERLSLEPDMKVIGEASNAEKALEMIPALQPDIVLMDLKMPVTDGLSATQTLQELSPESKVIVLSIYDDAVTKNEAKRAGALASVAKQDPEEVLLTTIRQTVEHQA